MENLESLLKKFVYTGVGLVSLSADRFKKTIEELVSDNKISEKEGKDIVKDFFKESDGKKKKYEGKIKEIIIKVTDKMKFAKADELEKLSKRLSELEKAVAKQQK